MILILQQIEHIQQHLHELILLGAFASKEITSLNKFSESLVLKRISPIQTNKGNAVKVHEDAVPHIVVAIASPTGL
jgi:hypothetical protein